MVFYLGLGTNLGNKEENLRFAVQEIEKRIGKVTSLSAFYATEPWGFSSHNGFLNAACRVEAGRHLSPLAVLHITQQIEREMGRTHKSVDGVYHDRLIDIDLLLAFESDGTSIHINSSELTIPHPLMRERDFVMMPLREILPTV